MTICRGRTAGEASGIPSTSCSTPATFDDDRYWIVEVHYAKADAHDLLMSIQVTNAGPDAATVHVLPSAWFRNTWSWDADAPRPELAAHWRSGGGDQPPVPRGPGAGRRPRTGRPPTRPCCSATTRPTCAASTA